MTLSAVRSRFRRYATLFDGHSGRILLIVTFGWGVIQVGRKILPPLLPRIISEVGITPARAGALLSVMSVTYAVAQYPSGQLSDHLSRGTLIVPGLVLLAVGFGAFALVPTYLLLLAGAATLGVGRAAFSIPARALISDLFGGRQGRALGVFTSASDLGGVLAAGIAVAVLSLATWRTPFLPVAGLLLVVLALVHRRDREAYVLSRTGLGVRETAARLARADGIRGLLAAYTLFRFAIRGVVGFLPTFLQAAKGFSPTVATAGFSVVYLVGVPTKPAAGLLSDRLPRPTIAAGGLSLSAAGFAVLLAVGSPALVLPAIAVFAVGYKGIFPVMDAFFMEASPAGNEGADLGAIRAAGSTIGSLGPVYVGVVAQRASYTLAFAGLGGTLLVSALLHWWLARTVARDAR